MFFILGNEEMQYEAHWSCLMYFPASAYDLIFRTLSKSDRQINRFCNSSTFSTPAFFVVDSALYKSNWKYESGHFSMQTQQKTRRNKFYDRKTQKKVSANQTKSEENQIPEESYTLRRPSYSRNTRSCRKRTNMALNYNNTKKTCQIKTKREKSEIFQHNFLNQQLTVRSYLKT